MGTSSEVLRVIVRGAAEGVFKGSENLVVGGDPLRRPGLRRALRIQRRDLPERKIFRETRSGAAVTGASQQAQEMRGRRDRAVPLRG